MSRTNQSNIWSLLGEFYLDTDLGDDMYLKTEKLIEQQGYTGLKKLIVELIAAGGFVHNLDIYGFEWTHLDSKYLVKGWFRTLLISIAGGLLFGLGLYAIFDFPLVYGATIIFIISTVSFIGNGFMHKKRILKKSNKSAQSDA